LVIEICYFISLIIIFIYSYNIFISIILF